jgi:hypothetical protein
MDKPSEAESGPIGELRDYVLGLLPGLGLSVSSVEVDGEHTVKVSAKSANQAMENAVLVEARRQKHRVGAHMLGKFKGEMDEDNVQEGVFISTSGFTDEAVDYSREHNIRLLTPEDIAQTQSLGEQQVGDEHNIFEKVFRESVDEEMATDFFNQRRRKGLLGLGGVMERVEQVEGRYAPVGCFNLVRRGGQAVSSQAMSVVEGENSFYVNLTTCELYYVYRGVAGRGARIKSSNVFRRMLDLPVGLVLLLSDIVEQDEVLFDRVSDGQRRLIQENMNNLVMLENLGLAGLREDGRGYISNVSLPPFTDARYNLGSFLDVAESVESSYSADEVTYPPLSILELLEDFYKAEGEFRGVTYMPYYCARYVDADGSVRFDAVDNIRFKDG